jgi:hypothetical protein
LSRRIPHKIQRYLEPKLSAIGRRSFETLCKAMCSDGIPTPYQTPPCHELAYWFDLLVTSQVKLADGRTINIRSLDSYRSALNGITLRKLRKIEREARALILDSIGRPVGKG